MTIGWTQRAIEELRELLTQESQARTYIRLSTGPRPDYVYLDDMEITSEPSSLGPSYTRVSLTASVEHILDENGRCAACDRPGGRNWVQEVNGRSARDTELQAQRYAAYRRMDQADAMLAREEDAAWVEVEHRIRRGKQIPERPVRFSWLHGPNGEEG